MDHSKIITRLNNLEAAANLILDECRKTKKELAVDSFPTKVPKGRTDEQRTKVRLRRMKVLLKN